MTAKTKSTSLVTIASFLVFELLAFAAFSLANSILLYGIVAFAIFALLFLGTSLQLKHRGFTDFAIFVVPVVIYGLLLLLSPFSANLDSLTCVFVIIGSFSFSAIGAYMRMNKEFNLSTAFIVIYGALAALVLISFGWNMIQYEPFYTLKYSDAYSYYDGMISSVPIGNAAYFLVGFQFQKVSIEYFSFFPSLLTSAVIGLFFIKPSQNLKVFLAYAGYALLGFITLIFMPSKMTLLTDILLILIYIFIFVFVFIIKNKQNIGKYLMFIVAGALVLLVGFMVINSTNNLGFIESHSLLNRLFNTNRVVAPMNFILKSVFKDGAIFGFNPLGIYQNDYFTSSSFLFDNFMMAGLIGGFIFIFIICWGAYSVYQMCVKSDIPLSHKTLIVTFIVTYFAYCIVNYDMQPYIIYSNFIPFFMSGPFFVVLFLTGYSFKLKKAEEKAEVVPVEAAAQEEEINI